MPAVAGLTGGLVGIRMSPWHGAVVCMPAAVLIKIQQDHTDRTPSLQHHPMIGLPAMQVAYRRRMYTAALWQRSGDGLLHPLQMS